MRSVLSRLSGISHHFGLDYDVLAPAPGQDGSHNPERRDQWIERCVSVSIPADYGTFFQAWRKSFPDHDVREVELKSRLLVGHGNPSSSEVGLTVHRTWGVPMIPGSALKGLTANYTSNVYGQLDSESGWNGLTWNDWRITGPAGANFAHLFGSPDIDGHTGQARQGLVTFQDALYVPPQKGSDNPFVRDVLTPHQSDYYRTAGGDWPNDWTSPIPVSFVTVKPRTRFLLAVSGPDDWRTLAMRLLTEALDDWGAGAKTSLGYGHLG